MSISKRKCQSNFGYRGWRRLKVSMIFLMALSLTIGFAFAQSVFAADPCPDNDSDGYVVCDGICDPSGKDCGECNDGDADIKPDSSIYRR